jgi:hypothetical protein
MIRPHRRTVLTMLASACLPATAALAADGTRPILTVGGLPGGTSRAFDRSGLEALGTTTLEEVTPWYEGRRRFDGVSLTRVLAEAGASKVKAVHLHALNDYAVDLPMAEVKRYQPILALKRDGTYMTVREKGPLFLVFPFDEHPEIRTPWYYSRAIWQVDAVTVAA